MCLWGPFSWKTIFHPLTLSQCLSFSVRCISRKQYLVGSCFWTQFDILFCLVIGALRRFTVSVKIERFLFPVIFIHFMFSFTYSIFTCLLVPRGLFSLE
jgi:hypothetical protein